MDLHVPHLYSGDDGESHWGEVLVALEASGAAATSVLQDGPGVSFVRVPGEVAFDWHPAPRRQYVITLAGEVEYETGDGTRRRFEAGDIFLADDVTGRGHAARCRDLVQAFVPLD